MFFRFTGIKTFGVCLAVVLLFLLPGSSRAEITPADTQSGRDVATVQASDASPSEAGEQSAAVSLEQAIRIAKEAFAVPEGLSQFTTGFDQSGDQSFWNLRWYRSGDYGGEMNVRVNTQTGEIWSMSQYVPPAPGQEYQGLPKYSREQAESVAAALAEKLQPERFKFTSLQLQQYYYQPLTFQKRGQIEYQYNYARIVDGVPYAENGISVSVSGDTGQVIRFDLSWDEIKGFPPAAGRISQEQAEQIFRTEAGPELTYFRERTPGGREVSLKLVYRLPGSQDRAVIDALTGKVLNREDDFYSYYNLDAGGGMEKRANSQAAVPLSPVEESAVEEAKNLLSRERALDMARSAVKVPEEYVLNNSRLEQDYLFQDKKIWHFNWEAGSGAERKAMDIAVDAATGELVSFSTNAYRTMYDYLRVKEVKFSKEAALKIAGDYIKKVQPAKWEQIEYKNSRPEYGPVTDQEGKPQARAYSFNWVRLEQGVPFPDNGFNLVVDSVTGEITSYRMTWWDVEFPDPQGVLSREAAADKYLKGAPLTAAYMRIWTGDMYSKTRQEGQVYLVYYTARQNFTMLDAFTGELLDYQGNVVIPNNQKQKFEDLEGHPARAAVELLAQTGIVTAGGKFRPDDAVTQAELITMLVKSSGQYPAWELKTTAAAKEPWYQKYYETAARLGIIQVGESPDPDLPVTREVLARLTIHAMGFYKVASLSDLYVLNFQDAGDITDYLRGHAALAVGLGLIEPVDGKFQPKALVTRGEAAETLVRMLKNN
ncbi:YcdB/YcdC domain-containing protein [Pelotomaculum propionicicum]|uniref:Endo-1,4-beta-xylanase A n=1 Tax=Pelotomaculum propionicicum TaxID=258475 RepID=A0A4Y7RRM8_9FIRM|nr:YcdB/YcdC domain-containing protein [Pelotomaculum propionicicum]TEB11664.1 Endo-1,4-beta-xylanase A [Pelotomaculum propionicicum]